MNKKMALVFGILAISAYAKDADTVRVGSPEAPVIRASEVTNISFVGTAPATFTGALDADDSVFNRPTSCTALSGVGTAAPFDTVVLTNNSGNPGNVVISSSLVGGAVCLDANDTFFALYSTFNPATPLAGCLAVNDDIAGSANRCSSLTFAMAAGEVRTVVVTGFNNATAATGLFPYQINFTGTTGTPGGGTATLSLSNAGAVNFGTVNVSGSGTATLTVSNTGTAALDVTALAAPTTPFTRTGGTCGTALPFSVAQASSCTIVYAFSPAAVGVASQTLAITTNGGNGTITLTGNGNQVVQTPNLNTAGLALMVLAIGFLGFAAARRFS